MILLFTFIMLIALFIAQPLQIVIRWNKFVYYDNSPAENFGSFFFREFFSSFLPANYLFPSLISDPKDNKEETLRLVKKINILIIVLYVLEIIILICFIGAVSLGIMQDIHKQSK